MLQKNSIKNLAMLLNLIKRKKTKQKTKKCCARSNRVYDNYFISYKYHSIKKFTKRSLDSKLNDLNEFKDKLELFYYDTIEIMPNNEDQIKDLEERKLCLIQL